MTGQIEDRQSLPHGECPADIIHRRQITAMAVAVVLLLGCLVGTLRHSRIVSWPMGLDADCLCRVRQGVDVNTAEWPQLAQLPGIGEGIARRIVEYRESKGAGQADGQAFRRPGDLSRVSGIGPKTVMRITSFVRFEDEESVH